MKLEETTQLIYRKWLHAQASSACPELGRQIPSEPHALFKNHDSCLHRSRLASSTSSKLLEVSGTLPKQLSALGSVLSLVPQAPAELATLPSGIPRQLSGEGPLFLCITLFIRDDFFAVLLAAINRNFGADYASF